MADAAPVPRLLRRRMPVRRQLVPTRYRFTTSIDLPERINAEVIAGAAEMVASHVRWQLHRRMVEQRKARSAKRIRR